MDSRGAACNTIEVAPLLHIGRFASTSPPSFLPAVPNAPGPTTVLRRVLEGSQGGRAIKPLRLYRVATHGGTRSLFCPIEFFVLAPVI